MGLDQRELYRIRVTMEKETNVGSVGIELQYEDRMVCTPINNISGFIT